MMDHIRQRDWNSTKYLYNRFVTERDLDTCVVERIVRNKFWDPRISDDEEEESPKPIDWEYFFATKNFESKQSRRLVPGFRKIPPHPKLSALTKDEHFQFIRVLSAQNERIMPRELVGKPRKADWTAVEAKKEIYAKEQEEYLEWAKHMWTTSNCIRALRPKPLVEKVYEAEFKMKSHMIQCFPKNFKLAAQIPLKADNQSCEIVLPKNDLIKVNISELPKVIFPDIYENKEIILRKWPLPEPCAQHPCRFILPGDSELSLLPLTELHKELAQFAVDSGAEFVASERGLRCLLETDRGWSLALSVCEAVSPDGDKSNVVVLGSEFPEKRDPALMRTYRAYGHLLLNAFSSQSLNSRTSTDQSDSSPQMSLRSQQSPNTRSARSSARANRKTSPGRREPPAPADSAAKKGADYLDSDSDDEHRLEIVMDDDEQETNDENDNNIPKDINNTNGNNEPESQPRKILRARPRLSLDRKMQMVNPKINRAQFPNHIDSQNKNKMESQAPSEVDPESSNVDNQPNQTEKDEAMNQANIQENLFEIGRLPCVCKGTFEKPSARSYKNLLIKNHTTKDQLNLIVHSSHKLKNVHSYEVLLEPIIEYQLELGGTAQSPQKIQSLAMSLMLRKNAELVNVRVDGPTGEVVTIDSTNLRALTAQQGDFRADIANTLYTTFNQLAGLLPGSYVLKHEPNHGANALLYSRSFGVSGTECVPLQAPDAALTPAEEARLVQAAPRLQPVLLPLHKYRRHLPLAFTYNQNQVAREITKSPNKKKTPPAALTWPKKRGKKKRKTTGHH